MERRAEHLLSLTSGPSKQAAELVLGYCSHLPNPAAYDILDRLQITLQERRSSELIDLARVAEFSLYTASCRVLSAIPQRSVNSIGNAGLFVEGLQIDIPDGLGVEEYLSIIRSHRGVLDPSYISSSPDTILPKVQEMNAEVRAIERSSKLAIGKVLAGSIFPGLASVGMAFATHGLLNHEVGDAVKSIASKDRAETPAGVKFLSKYFGTDKEVIHVWQVRQRIRGASSPN